MVAFPLENLLLLVQFLSPVPKAWTARKSPQWSRMQRLLKMSPVPLTSLARPWIPDGDRHQWRSFRMAISTDGVVAEWLSPQWPPQGPTPRNPTTKPHYQQLLRYTLI